jgi:hypothetical protein
MKQKTSLSWKILIVVVALIQLGLVLGVDPVGPQIISNVTEEPTPRPGQQLVTEGGSFTTLVLNVTAQTQRWKAYVGNVTGRLTLDDASNYTIYDWQLSTIAGEVYISRNSSITWSEVKCANASTISAEETFMNHTPSNPDSISNTFNNTIHKSFWVGTTLIANSSCPAIATYVNDTSQAATENATYQEILLTDGNSLIYATILEENKFGFDFGIYDFQIIVAENEFVDNTPYFFWVELT